LTPIDKVERLRGVNALLSAALIIAAYRYCMRNPDRTIRVTEGLRSPDRQRKLVAQNKSWTLNSKHIVGRAVDVAIMENGEPLWDLDFYRDFNEDVQFACDKLSLIITWGGDWPQRDGVHFQLET